jgi:glutathione synthase/RimK-type ligase-like ATP-grasp enzyme
MTTILRKPKLGKYCTKAFAEKMTTPVRIMRYDRAHLRRFRGYPDDTDLLIRWGCTAQSPVTNVLNTVEAIKEVNDKTAFRVKLAQLNLAPITFTQYNFISDYDWVFARGLKLVVRPRHHAQGRHVYLVSNLDELNEAKWRCGDGWYASLFINKVAEYRVFVGSGRAVWVAKKTPADENAIAWNVAHGGRFDNVRFGEWPLKVVKTAILAFNASQLDFGGVDVMVDADNNCYVLEINSAPSQISPYRNSCVAKYFDYVVENGKERIPLQEERGGWRKFIHPSITENTNV